MKNVFFFTNIASHYRKLLWLYFLRSKEMNFNVFFGDPGKTGINEIDFSKSEFLSFNNNFFRVKNFWFNNKIIIWQSDVVFKCLFGKLDVAIFTSDMYCLSTWIGALVCRFRKIEVVFWGHGIYGNESKFKLFLRVLFYRLANKHLLYEKKGKSLMIENGFEPDKLFVIYNSLDYDSHLQLRVLVKSSIKSLVFSFFSFPTLPVLVFIGRLTPQKKLSLLIDAFFRINDETPICNLLIIGDGPEKAELLAKSKKGIDAKLIYFTGSIYDEKRIAELLYHSDICVSPGNVGLTAIHSLSLGTPVASHNNFFNQMPEVEAIIDGYNGFLFNEDDVDDLCEKIYTWLNSNEDREIVRNKCYEVIDKYYNPKYQIKVMKKVIK
ncbi:glycosyltransferase family 4 protein [Cyclobacterium marinum]|uniref:glycosyltransferase family 4 protein n=1 Tax=Cyclobacterium marinum TaxID=104 RepID=UPI0011F053A4|nr:glycosyltransferase family 4 protein [Cyclobacterium marinum]MBI0400164.1 glycosyltransferase family 4 protein [Cyclobacterium marinum]